MNWEKRNLKSTLLIFVAVSSSFLVGCAKEKPFDTVYREVEQLKRSQFVIEENGQPVEYLYVPSTLGTPMEVADARPFYQGDEKVVRLEWSEEGLEVLEIERDQRFTDNVLNDSPVLTIPGSYKEYRCAEDAFGECTNREEENTELEWYDKTSFTPDFEKLEVRELNSLDIFAISGASCLSTEATRVVDYEINDGVINVELEKSYRVSDTNFMCFIRSFFNDNLSTNSFKVKFFYSLVRLDKLASPNYKAVSYPVPDHNDFGFFEKEELLLNGEFDRARKDRRILMNRWNPNRPNGELTYHLSPEYSKPENSLILKATKEAVEVMNKEMAAANVNLNIKLVEQPDPKTAVNSGDLRYTSLVLIEDPLANGLLGYGPSVANPYTGEIVQAHTNMYLGVLKSMTRRVYDSAVDLTEDEFKAANPAPALVSDFQIAPSALSNIPAALAKLHIPELLDAPAPTPSADDTPSDDAPADDTPAADAQNGDDTTTDAVARLASALKKPSTHAFHAHNHEEALSKVSHSRVQRLLKKRLQSKRNLNMDALIEKLKEEKQISEEEENVLRKEARLSELSENNAFAVEFFPIGGTSKVVYPELKQVPGIMTEKGTLKRWTLLNKDQRKAVQDIILVSSYKATLIHEIGHNLGLRHNFSGSFDKENFLTDEEARDLGMQAAPAYSSIMDYSFSEFNQLKALGKYDLAALRFGYTSEVELTDGNIAKIEIPAEEKIQNMEPKDALEFLTNHAKQVAADSTTTTVVSRQLLNAVAGVNQNTIGTLNPSVVGQRLEGLIKTLKATNNDMVFSTLNEFKESKSMEGKELKSYQFCTDENAGLSTTCNRFDEGTSLVEVTKHMIKRYKDAYKYRNFRDGRLDFSAYDVVDYYFWRNWEFGKIRDVLEEYEFFVGIFGPELMAQGCTPDQVQQFPVCAMVNDRKDAVKIVSDFFLEVLKTPDHQCALVNKDAPNMVVEYRKLNAIYDEVKFDLDDNRVTTNCFDPAVKEKVAEDNLLVVGENGKFLNGFKDTDPNFRYVTDRATRGIWADKVLAMKNIFKRRWNKSTTDDAHMALIDLPDVREQTDMILAHLLEGKPMQEPLPFTTENGQQFTIPYAIGNDNLVNQVEDAFARIRRRIGMDESGTTSLIKLTMNQIQRIGTRYGEEYKDVAFETRNLPAVLKVDGVVPTSERIEDEVYFFDKKARLTFGANDFTPIAKKMIISINSLPKLMATSTEDLDKVLSRKLNPQPNVNMSAEEKLFWNVSEELQGILIDAAETGRELPEAAFLSTFGPTDGPILFAFFKKGAEPMKKVVEIKEEVRNAIPTIGVSDELKEIYKLPVQVLVEFKLETLNEEVAGFYQDQLRKMPIYLNYDVGPRRQ
jgi:hypothetical protein